MSQEAADLFTRLAPVLNVRDLAAERAFYQSLGLPVIYEARSTGVHRVRNRDGAFRHPESASRIRTAARYRIAVSGVRSAIARGG